MFPNVISDRNRICKLVCINCLLNEFILMTLTYYYFINLTMSDNNWQFFREGQSSNRRSSVSPCYYLFFTDISSSFFIDVYIIFWMIHAVSFIFYINRVTILQLYEDSRFPQLG